MGDMDAASALSLFHPAFDGSFAMEGLLKYPFHAFIFARTPCHLGNFLILPLNSMVPKSCGPLDAFVLAAQAESPLQTLRHRARRSVQNTLPAT